MRSCIEIRRQLRTRSKLRSRRHTSSCGWAPGGPLSSRDTAEGALAPRTAPTPATLRTASCGSSSGRLVAGRITQLELVEFDQHGLVLRVYLLGMTEPGATPNFELMGVVNVTPDSFSDGGRYLEAAAAIGHGRELERE